MTHGRDPCQDVAREQAQRDPVRVVDDGHVGDVKAQLRSGRPARLDRSAELRWLHVVGPPRCRRGTPDPAGSIPRRDPHRPRVFRAAAGVRPPPARQRLGDASRDDDEAAAPLPDRSWPDRSGSIG